MFTQTFMYVYMYHRDTLEKNMFNHYDCSLDTYCSPFSTIITEVYVVDSNTSSLLVFNITQKWSNSTFSLELIQVLKHIVNNDHITHVNKLSTYYS